MIKKIVFAGLGIALLATPLLASADTAGDLQTQIQALLAQVQQLQVRLTALQNQATTTTSILSQPDQPVVMPCVQILRPLTFGAQGTDVTALQNTLIGAGDLPAGSATGFFGTATQTAVQKVQAQNGIVASGDPTTTGFGAVGPNTRAWFAKHCGSGNQNFSASPVSGPAPLAVQFRSTVGGTIDFGDGTTGTMNSAPVCASCQALSTAGHTYTAAGTYIATLTYQPPFVCNAPAGAACAEVMPAQTTATVTITVGVAAAPGAPSISGLDAPASLAIGQTGTWTVHASVANTSNAQLQYSVTWGDESVLDRLSAIAGNAPSTLQTFGSFTHAYATAGTYTPTFIVSNSVGSAQTSASVAVGGGNGVIGGPICPMYQMVACPAGQHALPGTPTYDANGCAIPNQTCVPNTTTSAAFSATPTSGAAPLAVQFSSNTGGSINFGDGTSGTFVLSPMPMYACPRNAAFSTNPGQTEAGCMNPPPSYSLSHTYASASTYTATLATAGSCLSGYCAQTASVTITVTGKTTLSCPNYSLPVCVNGSYVSQGTDANGCQLPSICSPAPSGTLSASATTGAAPLTVTFAGVSSAGINFGDSSGQSIATSPSAGNGQTAMHTYAFPGTFTATSGGSSVTITVTGPCSAGTTWQQACPAAVATCQAGTSADGASVCATLNTSCTWGCYTTASPGQGTSAGSGTTVGGSCTISGNNWICSYQPTSNLGCKQQTGGSAWICPYQASYQCGAGPATVTSPWPCSLQSSLTASASEQSSNLASALTALQSALKALAAKLGQ